MTDHLRIDFPSVEDLYDGKAWVHPGITDEKQFEPSNISLTLFLITIQSEQLQHSLDAINLIKSKDPIIVHVIMNVSPTNRAYNEMRIRCTTPYFIQCDEDMELYPRAIDILMPVIRAQDSRVYLTTYKLIDTVLGVGSPPIIDCLKLYNNTIMKDYPTFSNGDENISSVDVLWHAQLNGKYRHKHTSVIIGLHGNHRCDFDIMIRYCKILTSLLDPRIKTNSGHVCKLVRPLCSLNINSDRTINMIIQFILDHLFYKFSIDMNPAKGNECINAVNTFISSDAQNLYKITNKRVLLQLFPLKPIICGSVDKYSNEFISTINHSCFYCLLGILCVATNNYAYDVTRYPTEIYKYFHELLNNKS
jgi:hypothetical protein